MGVQNQNDAPGEDEDEQTTLNQALTDLVSRAQNLFRELNSFREYLQTLKETHVEVAHFKNTVQSELNMLEKLLHGQSNRVNAGHIVQSSNLPFLEHVWGVAKRSKKIVALTKRVYFNSPRKSLSQNMYHVDKPSTKKQPLPNDSRGAAGAAVTVDAIVDGGTTWVKVSLVTNHRLLFDLAKQGWNSGDSETDEGSDDGSAPSKVFDAEDDDDIPLVKNARDLCRAAQSYRARTKTPVVHLMLPRVQPGEIKEVDKILDKCRTAGAILHCGEDFPALPSIADVLHEMAVDPLSMFSDTLNIDCTILLALVSDFSHARVSKEPWFHKALRRQVEIEGNENLLPSLLYPALGNRKLVSTTEAAKRMREIVNTIGTRSEKARTEIMMGDDKTKSQSQLIDAMQQWSNVHEVPADWQLPIRVVDQNEDGCQLSLPDVADAVGEHMTAINRSVFFHGWATGRTTITSNRVAVKQIDAELEKQEDLDDSVWPKLWLCPVARSLVGKEKRGAKKGDKPKAWPLPDSLRREHQRLNGLDVLSLRNGYEVEDLRPNGYDYEDIIAAKTEASRAIKEQHSGTEPSENGT